MIRPQPSPAQPSPGPMSGAAALFCALALTCSAPAQNTPSAGRASISLVEPRWSPTRSWALFAACDVNSDDRIGFLEASDSIGVAALEDRAAFRATFQRLDVDNDGFVQFQEFDRHFRTLVQKGDPLRLEVESEPVEPFDPTTPPTPTSLEVALIRTRDRDRDEVLSDVEFREFVLAADLTANPTFAQVDVDASGTVGPEEMAAILPLMRDGGRALLEAFQRDPSTLPPHYERADVDHSGTLDHDELRQALIIVDPSLQRWSSTILGNADLSSNGALDRRELERAESVPR